MYVKVLLLRGKNEPPRNSKLSRGGRGLGAVGADGSGAGIDDPGARIGRVADVDVRAGMDAADGHLQLVRGGLEQARLVRRDPVARGLDLAAVERPVELGGERDRGLVVGVVDEALARAERELEVGRLDRRLVLGRPEGEGEQDQHEDGGAGREDRVALDPRTVVVGVGLHVVGDAGHGHVGHGIPLVEHEKERYTPSPCWLKRRRVLRL